MTDDQYTKERNAAAEHHWVFLPSNEYNYHSPLQVQEAYKAGADWATERAKANIAAVVNHYKGVLARVDENVFDDLREQLEAARAEIERLKTKLEVARHANKANYEMDFLPVQKERNQLRQDLAVAVEKLEQIDAEWCKHTALRLDKNKKLDRDWCGFCSEWIYRNEINPAREALTKIKTKGGGDE